MVAVLTYVAMVLPLLHKLKQLYKLLPVGFLIDIAYTANNTLYKLYTKMAVYS